MAKIPTKAFKFVKDHYKEIGAVITTGRTIGAKIVKNRKENKIEKGKVPFRKERFMEYKKEILKNLENKKRKELFQYKLEVEQYIEQIRNEESQQLKLKKPLLSKELKNWQEILNQLEDWMITRDYNEYYLIFNDPDYASPYFEGFTTMVERFRELLNEQDKEKLYNFIHDKTNKDISRIRFDFS